MLSKFLMREGECGCVKDNWTVFGGWVEKLRGGRVTPGYVEFFLGLTLEGLYRCYAGKDIKAGSVERVKRRVLKNRVLVEGMAYWLRLLSELKLSPKERREISVSFWVKTDFCLSHWWIAYNHVLRNWSWYSQEGLKEFLIPEGLRERMEKAVFLISKNRGLKL